MESDCAHTFYIDQPKTLWEGFKKKGFLSLFRVGGQWLQIFLRLKMIFKQFWTILIFYVYPPPQRAPQAPQSSHEYLMRPTCCAVGPTCRRSQQVKGCQVKQKSQPKTNLFCFMACLNHYKKDFFAFQWKYTKQTLCIMYSVLD